MSSDSSKPRFYPGHVVGCMSTFSKPGVNCNCEGTPKLEEIARRCVELAERKFSEAMNEEGPAPAVFDIRTSDFAAILRPFITPACTPPDLKTWLGSLDHWAIGEDVFGDGVTSLDCGIIGDTIKAIIERLPATPASTGEYEDVPPLSNLEREELDELRRMKMPELFPSTEEANGWISVEERLPKHNASVLVRREYFAPEYQSAKFCEKHSKGTGFYCGDRVNGVTHWKHLDSAPTSVPQAELPKMCECGCGQIAVGSCPTPQSHEADYCTGPCCSLPAEPKGETP